MTLYAITPPARLTGWEHPPVVRRLDDVMARCKSCGRPARLTPEQRPRDVRPACPGCGGSLYVPAGAEIVAQENGQPCNAICMNARGPSCDCSCGGANHGAGWAIGLSLF